MLKALMAVNEGKWLPDLPDTVAILDFDDCSEGGADAWIGSGLADSLGTDLARAPELGVVPRDRVLASRARLASDNAESRAVELGLALGCRWVVAGEYQRSQNEVHVTVHLVKVATSRALATTKLSGVMSELFAMRIGSLTFVTSALKVAATTPPATRPALSAYQVPTPGGGVCSSGSKRAR